MTAAACVCYTFFMSKKVVQTQVAYNRPEELTNIITHAVAAALSFVGLVFLMLKTTALGYAPLGIASAFIYGLAMITMFVISTLYHAMPYGSKRRAVFRRLDHCTISVLIFGTYAPVMLIGMMRGTSADMIWGYTLFAVVSATAILSVVFNAINVTKFKVFSLIAYVVMGWACVIRINRIVALCGWGCFWFLIGGGLAYSLGIIFYAIKKIPFNHALWHFFVTAGAALQFVGVYAYLI